jgi:hypothetical protein
MKITPRLLLASIAATAALSGTVGALAASATSSQATPAAIAAAVQKVRDTTADERLAAITRDLGVINDDLGGTEGQPSPSGLYKLLEQICNNGATAPLASLKCGS